MNQQEKDAVQARVGAAIGRRGQESMGVAIRRALAGARGRTNPKMKILARRLNHAQQAIDEGREVGWERLKKAIDDADAGLGDRPTRGR